MEEYPQPASMKCIWKISEQMSNSFCKINEYDIGFFCHIKYYDEKIPVMIINNYIRDKDYNGTIEVIMNNKHKKIELGNVRYKNKEYNISILEIKENKNEKYNFIEIDDKIYSKDSYMYYNNESIYILQMNNINNIFVSYGVIEEIIDTKISYIANLYHKSNFSLIFNLNNKLIGIGGYNYRQELNNIGIYFNEIINDFINQYRYNRSNSYKNFRFEINLSIEINKEDINHKIYFLDNYKYQDKKNIKHFGEKLKALNELIEEFYINNIKCEFKNYFIPAKEGLFDIKMKFNTNLFDCSYMFAGCENIISINFISINTKNITDMKYMFYGCRNLRQINLFSFDTRNVTDMSGMFGECNNLKELDLSSFDIKNVRQVKGIFYKSEKILENNLSLFKKFKKEELITKNVA
jgi:surface protein